MCSQPSASASRGDGRPLDEDLAVVDAQVGGQQRPAGRAELAPASAGRQRRHLRAGLGQAVGLDHRGAAPDRLLERLLGDRAAADQDRPRAGEVGAGVEQAGQHRRHHRDDRDPVALQRRGDPVDVEAVVEHRGGAVDHRAHHDREPRDVAQRQAAEPAVVRVDADVEGRADGAPEVVAVGEADRAGLAGAAAGQDPAVDLVHVVLAEQRQVGLAAETRSGRPRVSTGSARRRGALGPPAGVERVGDRHQR